MLFRTQSLYSVPNLVQHWVETGFAFLVLPFRPYCNSVVDKAVNWGFGIHCPVSGLNTLVDDGHVRQILCSGSIFALAAPPVSLTIPWVAVSEHSTQRFDFSDSYA